MKWADMEARAWDMVVATRERAGINRIFIFLILPNGWMLYRRGRPTSVILLLLMVIAKVTLPLSRHPPLGLYHGLCLVGAARGLVSLGGVVVLEVGLGVVAGVAAAKFGHRVGTRAAGRRCASGCGEGQ